jgi:UDP-N-acetylmuramoylalanine--D-glutamate ligase
VEYLLNGQDKDFVVAEISSFQLDSTRHFCPRVGVLLNITEDHLDRYPDFQGYIQSKAGLFRNQGKQDAAVLNWDDPLVRGIGETLKGPVYYFSRIEPLSRGAYLDLDRLRLNLSGPPEEYDLQAFPLPGVHNRENALAAVLGARLLGAAPEAVQRALERFKGFRHRLEWVAEVRGIQFFDDSKGTNVGAVVKALEGFSRPVILIAGGRDKGGDYGPLKGLIRGKVKALILIGEAREKMRDQLGDLTPTELADSLETAVSWSFRQGEPGDVVLLSPGCSSFDMFRDYAQRGEVFQQAVKALTLK